MREKVKEACKLLLHWYENGMDGTHTCPLCMTCRYDNEECHDCPWVSEIPHPGKMTPPCETWFTGRNTTPGGFRMFADGRVPAVVAERISMLRRWLI